MSRNIQKEIIVFVDFVFLLSVSLLFSLLLLFVAYPRVRSFIEMRRRLFLPVVRQMGRVTTSIPDVFLRRDVFSRDFGGIPAIL